MKIWPETMQEPEYIYLLNHTILPANSKLQDFVPAVSFKIIPDVCLHWSSDGQ